MRPLPLGTPLKSPFSSTIHIEKVSRVKCGTLTYDDTIDPRDHIAAYFAILDINNHSDATGCRNFATTLSGIASTWFHNLVVASINSFDELQSMFESHFIITQKVDRTEVHLLGLRQEQNESVQDYLARFRKEYH